LEFVNLPKLTYNIIYVNILLETRDSQTELLIY